MKLTLLDYDPKTLETTAPYGTITLMPDGTLDFGGNNVKRAQKCYTNARDAIVRSGNRQPTAEQVMTWLSTKSPKAGNGRITVET